MDGMDFLPAARLGVGLLLLRLLLRLFRLLIFFLCGRLAIGHGGA